MVPFVYTIINAVALISLGLWGYISSDNPSMTALIPVISGIIFLALSKGMKNENKVVAHIVVILTLVIFVALIKPLTAAFSRSDTAAETRVIIMMLTSLAAIISYIKSFIDARK